jgi:energy-coupling factor transport system ATP-binding protein
MEQGYKPGLFRQMKPMMENALEPTLGTPACRVEDYSYRHPFADDWALRDINLCLESGQTLAVFGDSGSGKTTLFASIAGLNGGYYRGGEARGAIRLFEDPVAETALTKLVKHYGLVTQDFRNQLLADEVEAAIAFTMESRGAPVGEMKENVEALLGLLGIKEIRNKNIQELSGGQGQRVAIGCMLAKEPKMMIFDDIASDIDPRGQEDIQSIMKGLKDQAITLLVTDSSDPRFLLTLADKAFVLDGGEKIFFGNPAEIETSEYLSEKAGISIPEVEFREPKNSPLAIEITGARYTYGRTLAVDEVSCQVVEGSITGIIGHNGSGKTTLLKMIGGLYKATQGSVLVNGVEPGRLPAEQAVRYVAYLPQNTRGIFFEDSVAKELAYTPKVVGIAQRYFVEDVGLSGLEDQHPEFLSGGQRQRLAIACALSSQPQVLLLDEPTKGLNQKERLALAETLLKLQQEGKTLVLVSHDWQLIARATENLLVMNHGRLVRSGATKDILSDRDFFNQLGMPLPWEAS